MTHSTAELYDASATRIDSRLAAQFLSDAKIIMRPDDEDSLELAVLPQTAYVDVSEGTPFYFSCMFSQIVQHLLDGNSIASITYGYEEVGENLRVCMDFSVKSLPDPDAQILIDKKLEHMAQMHDQLVPRCSFMVA